MSRILWVEDARDAAAPALQDELQRAGHEIEHIDDGAVALHRILTAPPALTLLDVALPHVSGLQILEKVRARSDHPIIMLTARDGEADRLRGFELGADDYVGKPCSPRRWPYASTWCCAAVHIARAQRGRKRRSPSVRCAAARRSTGTTCR